MSTSQRSRSGNSMLVVGAGVGGLMVALEGWRRGCDVLIFERAASSITTGDSFTIGPTAIKAIAKWPDMMEEANRIAFDCLVAYHKHTGERILGPMSIQDLFSKDVDAAALAKLTQRHSRPKFHAMLMRQIAKLSIQIRYGMEVVDYFEKDTRAGVVLSDGEQHEADIVVAADGVRGHSWKLIAEQPVEARSSGHAIFRAAFPVEVAIADPMIDDRFKLLEDGRSVFEMWVGPGMHAAFWRSEDQMSWFITHEDHGTAEESWNRKLSPEDALRITSTVPGWPEVADRVIESTPPGILVDYKLMWRDPQPRWTSPGGRVVQLGDAAHTFLPSSGNGATQAIEDSVSLATCLGLAGKSNIPDATRVHNLLRFERVSCLQAFGVQNQAKNNSAVEGAKADPKKTAVHMGRWILDHDPEQYAYDNYKKALSHVADDRPFTNSNIPPGLVYKPWTIDEIQQAKEDGKTFDLGGDWD